LLDGVRAQIIILPGSASSGRWMDSLIEIRRVLQGLGAPFWTAFALGVIFAFAFLGGSCVVDRFC
jgi:hypothetical protein